MTEPPEVPELIYIIKTESPRKIVSNIYKIAMSHREHQYTRARLAWQRDMELTMDDDIWSYCCANTIRISLHGKHRLIHFKYINRVYHTPERLHRFGLRADAACDSCRAAEAGFLHLAWNCPGMSHFWGKIFQEISKIVGTEISPDPELALLGYTRGLLKAIRRMVDLGLLMAKQRVAMC